MITQLRLQAINKSFTQGTTTVQVLQGIDVTFDQGKTYAIMGSSGSGKSTLLHIIAGLDTPTFGFVAYNNQSITTMSAHKKQLFLQNTVGLVFQLPYLIAEFSVLENIMLRGLLAGVAYHACKEKALYLLHKVHLHEKKDTLPRTLSGGQQQRVAILRAIFNEPAFLLADEPTGNLDAHTAGIILDLLLECQRQWNMGLIISTHDIAIAQKMNTIMQLHEGKLALPNGNR